jgi:alpha,alpha-trehalase
VHELPVSITGPGQVSTTITPQGLLYLPKPYVVPGGRFNEMYGWDSYFIVRGLVEDKRIDLARSMIENFFFEIEHYGTVLNANRTYFLTRSQPPFLTSMVMAVYEAEKAAGNDDRDLAEKGYRWGAKDYEMFTARLRSSSCSMPRGGITWPKAAWTRALSPSSARSTRHKSAMSSGRWLSQAANLRAPSR